MLKASLVKFGDLSGIVFNRNTRNLVSGHQRQKSLPADAKIVVEKKYDQPTSSHTVAEGYVEFGDERIKYREVDAPDSWEVEAMLAANNHGGEWDEGLLKVLIADFPSIDLNISGFDMPKLKALNIEVKMPKPQYIEEEQTDEQYIASEEKTTEEIPTENAGGEAGNAFAETEEVKEAPGRRIVIIIDCPSEEVKQTLREKLRNDIESCGAKLF